MKETCHKCEAKFSCTRDTECWCCAFPPIVIPVADQSCLCPNCLKEKVIKRCNHLIESGEHGFIKALGPVKIPQEDIDYYYNEEGLLVMTKWYHLRRGECCENDCLHCGYK